MAQPLIVIAGPTATGKTAAAVKFSLKTGGEVISADSMQVYRGMNIGTAKPTMAEREGIPHHMLDIVNPDDPFSAAEYQKQAEQCIAAVHARGHIPVLAGGTGFYINGVIYGNCFTPNGNDEKESLYRSHLYALFQEKGSVYVHELLKAADPLAAETIHPNNVKRVIRALSYHHVTGQCISEHNKSQRTNKPVYDTHFFVLTMNRSSLYERINRRVNIMLEAGLLEEVYGLWQKGYHKDLVSMQGLGYKETIRYINGECTLAEAVEAIQTGTRHYAKRQLTWFAHRSPEAVWLEVEGHSAETLAEQMMEEVKRKELLYD